MPRHNYEQGIASEFPGSEYTDDELELLRAVDRYKTRTGRRFPSVTEILSVVKSLGYRKETPCPPSPSPTAPSPPPPRS